MKRLWNNGNFWESLLVVTTIISLLGVTLSTIGLQDNDKTEPRAGTYMPTVVSPSITNTSLTSGRFVLSSTGGLQADDGDAQFSGDTATFTKIDAPTTADYTIASATASAQAKLLANETLDGASDETEINAAIVALNGAGVKRHLMLIGDFVADGPILALSYVDVTLSGTITVAGTTAQTYGIKIDATSTAITNCKWTNIVLHRTGTLATASNDAALYITGDVSNSVVFQNCEFYCDVVAADAPASIGCKGILLYNPHFTNMTTYTTSPQFLDCKAEVTNGCTSGNVGISLWAIGTNSKPYFRNCIGISPSGLGGDAAGIYSTEPCNIDTTFDNCTGYGGTYGIALQSSLTMNNCTGYANSVTSNSSGIYVWSSAPTLNYCKGYSGVCTYSYGIRIEKTSTPILNGCVGSPIVTSSEIYWKSLTGSLPDSGQFRPYATGAYSTIDGWLLWVVGSNTGVTLNIGSTPGASDIAKGIDVSGNLVNVSIVPKYIAVASAGYMYATLSGSFTGELLIAYTVMNSYADNCGLYVSSTATAPFKINNCQFYGSKSSNSRAAYFKQSVGNITGQISNSAFISYGGQAALACDNAQNVPLNNCTIIGTLLNINSTSEFGTLPPGSMRTYKGSLTAGAVGNAVIAWQNPEAQALTITARTLITTPSTAAAVGDLGRATTVAVVEDCEDVWNEAFASTVTLTNKALSVLTESGTAITTGGVDLHVTTEGAFTAAVPSGYTATATGDGTGGYVTVSGSPATLVDGADITVTGTGHILVTVTSVCTNAVNTTYVERGTNCIAFTVPVTVDTNDIVAAESRAALDISTATYFLAKLRATTTTVAGDYQLLIDETAACASPSFSLNLPALTANTTTLVCLAINGGSAAGATCDAIISVGLKYTKATSVANTIYIDDWRACTVGTELFNDLALNATAYTSADSLTASAPLYVGAKNSDDLDCIIMYSQTEATTSLVGTYYITAQGQ
jgi:hypothetical protein